LYVGRNTHLQNLDICGNLTVTGDTFLNYLDVSANVDISGNLTVTGNVLSYGTIKATKYLPGQIVNVSMLSSSELSLSENTNPITVPAATPNYSIFTYDYTPKIATSYIIIEYQTKYTVEGSNGDAINARLNVNGEEISSTYQQWINAQGGGSRSGTIFPIVGRYTNGNTTTKIIGVYIYNNSLDDRVFVNSDNSTWLKITEIAQ